MCLNLSKLKVVHIGSKKKWGSCMMKIYHKDSSYLRLFLFACRIYDAALTILKIKLEKDFKFNDQSNNAASNANKMLGLMKRAFLNLEMSVH